MKNDAQPDSATSACGQDAPPARLLCTAEGHRRGGALRPSHAGAAVLMAAIAIWNLSGCTRSLVTDGVPTNYDRSDPAAEVVFYHNLATATKVSNDEALHALTLLADDEDPTKTFEDRVAAAKQRGWLNKNFDEPADVVAQKGMVAESLVRMLDIRGGVWLTLLGPTPRYSVRELVNLGVMPEDSSERQAMSGAEFIGMLGRARDNAILEKMRELRKTGE